MIFGLNAQDEKKPLKVISYNIWNGFDFRKDVERKNNVIEWLVDQRQSGTSMTVY